MTRRLPMWILAVVLAGCAGQKQPVAYEVPPECRDRCSETKKECDHDCYGGAGPNLFCLPSCKGSYNRCVDKCKVPIATPTGSR